MVPDLSRQGDEEQREEPVNKSGRNLALLAGPVAVLVGAGLVIGFVPHLADAAVSAAQRLMARPVHVGDTHAVAPSITGTTYLFGAGATLGAVAFAVASLLRHRLHPARRVARRPVAPGRGCAAHAAVGPGR